MGEAANAVTEKNPKILNEQPREAETRSTGGVFLRFMTKPAGRKLLRCCQEIWDGWRLASHGGVWNAWTERAWCVARSTPKNLWEESVVRTCHTRGVHKAATRRSKSESVTSLCLLGPRAILVISSLICPNLILIWFRGFFLYFFLIEIVF